jgi:transketolase
VHIALEAQAILAAQGIPARVVSVPCMDLFLARPEAERRAVIGDAPVKVAIEAAVRMGWDALIGSDGVFVGMDGFGASAPYKQLYQHFGITAQAAADAVASRLKA